MSPQSFQSKILRMQIHWNHSFLSWFWPDLTTPICISSFLHFPPWLWWEDVSACSSRPWSGWKVRCKMGTLPVKGLKGQRNQIWWATQLSWCKLIRKIQYTWHAIVFILYLEQVSDWKQHPEIIMHGPHLKKTSNKSITQTHKNVNSNIDNNMNRIEYV